MRLSLKPALFALVLAPMLLALSSRPAEAYCLDNLTSDKATAYITSAGTYGAVHVIEPGSQVCATPAAVANDYPLQLELENESGFRCAVRLHAGGTGKLGAVDRRDMGIVVPLLYCETYDANTNGELDLQPPWAHQDGAGERRSVRFLATADTQYWRGQDLLKNIANRTMFTTLSEVAAGNARGLIIAGDLTQDTRGSELKDYKRAMGYLESQLEDHFKTHGLAHLVYDGLGNHDVARQQTLVCFDGTQCPDQMMDMLKSRRRSTIPTKRSADKLHYSWDWHDVHFVQLNMMPSDRRPIYSDAQYEYATPHEALTFLKQDLAEHVGGSGRPVVLIHHFGIDDFSQGLDNLGHAVWWDDDQRKEYWEAIADYQVIALITGHAHEAADSNSIFVDWERNCLSRSIDWDRTPPVVTCENSSSVGPEKILDIIAGSARGDDRDDNPDPEIAGNLVDNPGAYVDISIAGEWLTVQRRDDTGAAIAFGNSYPAKTVFFGKPVVTLTAANCLPTGSSPFPCVVNVTATAVFPKPGFADVAALDQVRYAWTNTCNHPVGADSFSAATGQLKFTAGQVCTVKVTVTNKYVGKTASAEISLSVNQLPSMTAPANATLRATSFAGAIHTYTAPTATDPQDGALAVTCTPPSGFTFPIGTTTATCRAVDSEGHAVQKTFTVTVINELKPLVRAVVTPQANERGWHNTPVTVSWEIEQVVPILHQNGCTPVVISQDTPGRPVTCSVVDSSNNEGMATVTIKLDQVKPVVTFSDPSSEVPKNENGWYRTPVSVPYTVADVGSGLMPGTAAAGEYLLSVSVTNAKAFVSVRDQADNVGFLESDPVSIDMVAPKITARREGQWNNAGWSKGAITVTFACTDAHSGVDSCTQPQTLDQDGAGLSVTGRVVDRAGNEAQVNEDGINIDRTPPVVTARQLTPKNEHGWNNGPVRLRFEATDFGSGIGDILGDPLDGASPSAETERDFFVEGANQSSQVIWFTDVAGNVGQARAEGINIDITRPTISAARDRQPDSGSWYNKPVTVTFACADALSTIASCAPPETIADDGTGLSATGRAVDRAGNEAVVAELAINVDQTPPVVTARRLTPANAQGWNSGDVVVEFAATESLSGFTETAAGDAAGHRVRLLTVTGEGRHTVERVFMDAAGNRGVAIVRDINIDLTPPSLTLPADITVEATSASGAVVSAAMLGTATATDNLNSVTVIQSSQANAFAIGTTMLTWTASDGLHQVQGVQRVTVVDTTVPTVTVPGSITLDATTSAGAVVTFASSATDSVSGLLAPVCAPASGSTFPAGTTSVTCTATDQAHNTGAASFTVTVTNVTTPGEMRGDGFVRDDGAKYAFQFLARERASGAERARLSIRIDEDGRKKKGKKRDDRFESRSVEFIAFSDDPAIRPGRQRRPQVDTVLFRGVGEWNGVGGYRYEVFAQDEGEPGRHRESVRVIIQSPAGQVVASFEGELDGGNVQSQRLHR